MTRLEASLRAGDDAGLTGGREQENPELDTNQSERRRPQVSYRGRGWTFRSAGAVGRELGDRAVVNEEKAKDFFIDRRKTSREKGAWGMPGLSEAKKDVTSCEKPR